MTAPTDMTVTWSQSMSDINRDQWNVLAERHGSPFLEWEWLHLLETSGSASPSTGWFPSHLTMWKGSSLQAAAPLYIRTSSEGEFVFDHAWAEVAMKLNIPYYPKLVGMTPFTPTGAYSFLLAPEINRTLMTRLLVQEIERQVKQSGLSGSNFNFVDQSWVGPMVEQGYSPWEHQGYIWKNENFESFDDFLARFKAGQRKNIRKERASLRDAPLSIRIVTGDGITEDLLKKVYVFYSRHNDQFGPWSCKFLTPAFFQGLAQSPLRDRIILITASPSNDPEQILAMSMLVYKDDRLYGRYWGASVEIRYLHFELCYYTPIEWAIHNSISTFDPGMGGVHKTRRGFVSVPTYSLHRFSDPRMRMIMVHNMDAINSHTRMEIKGLNRHVPFKFSK